MEELYELHNISGDLLKIVKGEDVELPDGVETIDAYKKNLLDSHQKERDSVYLTKLDPVIKEKIETEKKLQYPAIANPVFNRIKTYADFTDEELKGKKLTEAIEMYHQRMEKKLTEAQGKGDKTKSEFIKDLSEKDTRIVALTTEIDELKVKHEKELGEVRQSSATQKDQYIHDDIFSKSMMKIQKDLTLTGEPAIILMKNGLEKRGYKTVRSEDNSLKITGVNGEDKLDLMGNKKADSFDVLAEQIARADGFWKISNGAGSGDPLPAGAGGGDGHDYADPEWT